MTLLTLDEIAENFAMFGDDWHARYSYLIDLGKKLDPMPDSIKTEENRVSGCISMVWLVAEVRDGRLHFQADSNGDIVKGLIYVMAAAFQGKSVQEVRELKVEDILKKISFDGNLLSNRRNGFTSMVNKIKELVR